MISKTTVLERLKTVMLSDSNGAIETLTKVIKSEVNMLLSEYLILEPNSLQVGFSADSEGMLTLCISAKSNKIIEAGRMLN